MKRVVITGMGINSCIGNSLEEVTHSLKNGISGTRFNPTYAELNFKSHVSAAAEQDFDGIDRKIKRFMGICAMYAYNAAIAAVEHAGLKQEDLANNPRYGIAGGSGGNSTASVAEMVKLLEEKGARKIGPFFVPRNMSNTITANVGVALKLQGVAHSITSACATSADAIGYAYNLIQLGKQDVMLAGGGEEDHWSQSLLFDAMGALCSKYNDSPETASRPYSADRDGFVIAGGGGFVVNAHVGEEGLEAVVVLVFDGIVLVIVALSALDPHPEEHPGTGSGDLLGLPVGLAVVGEMAAQPQRARLDQRGTAAHQCRNPREDLEAHAGRAAAEDERLVARADGGLRDGECGGDLRERTAAVDLKDLHESAV